MFSEGLNMSHPLVHSRALYNASSPSKIKSRYGSNGTSERTVAYANKNPAAAHGCGRACGGGAAGGRAGGGGPGGGGAGAGRRGGRAGAGAAGGGGGRGGGAGRRAGGAER